MSEQMKQELSQEEVMTLIERNIREGQAELEEDLKQLGHSQAKRLLLNAMKYPIQDYDAKDEEQAFRNAWANIKRIIDAQVALGVEVVIQNLAQHHGINTEGDANEQEKREE